MINSKIEENFQFFPILILLKLIFSSSFKFPLFVFVNIVKIQSCFSKQLQFYYFHSIWNSHLACYRKIVSSENPTFINRKKKRTRNKNSVRHISPPQYNNRLVHMWMPKRMKERNGDRNKKKNWSIQRKQQNTSDQKLTQHSAITSVEQIFYRQTKQNEHNVPSNFYSAGKCFFLTLIFLLFLF